jgi:succinoglycan biosynthesis transport protein ExoP
VKIKEKEFDLKEYLQILAQRKMLLFLPLVIVLSSGVFASFKMKPTYLSSTTILMKETKLLSRSIETIVPGGEQAEPSRQEQAQRQTTIRTFVTSSEFLRKVISTLKLENDPFMIEWAQKKKEKFPYLSVEELMERMWVDILRENLAVELKGENLLEISATSKSPQKAAQLAETIALTFIQESLKDELSGAKQVSNFSEEQLDFYRKKLEQSENDLRLYKERLLKRELEGSNLEESKTVELKSEMDACKQEIGEIDKKIDLLNLSLKEKDDEIVGLIKSSELDKLKEELSFNTNEYARLLSVYSWKDAKILALNAKIEKNFKKINEEIAKLVSVHVQMEDSVWQSSLKEYSYLNVKRDFLNEKWRALNQGYSELQEKIAQKPLSEQVLRKLEHEVELNRRIYEMLISQAQGSQISENVQQVESESRFRIIEPAQIPIKPTKPDKKKIVLFSMLAGLAIGVMAVVIAEKLDHSFKDVEDVESFLNLKVIGTVSRVDRLEKSFKDKTSLR